MPANLEVSIGFLHGGFVEPGFDFLRLGRGERGGVAMRVFGAVGPEWDG